MAKKIKEITKSEIQDVTNIISDATQLQKDHHLALLIISMDKIVEILHGLIIDNNLVLSQKKRSEIEHIISLGPKWLNYTQKRKK